MLVRSVYLLWLARCRCLSHESREPNSARWSEILDRSAYFYRGSTWSWCRCRSKIILSRHKFLKLLAERRRILHHVIKIDNLLASSFILQILKDSHLLIQHWLRLLFHSSRAHYLHVAVAIACLLALLPPVYWIKVFLVPLLSYSIELIIVGLKNGNVWLL